MSEHSINCLIDGILSEIESGCEQFWDLEQLARGGGATREGRDKKFAGVIALCRAITRVVQKLDAESFEKIIRGLEEILGKYSRVLELKSVLVVNIQILTKKPVSVAK